MKIYIQHAIHALVICAIAVSSCNSEKRAWRLMHRAERVNGTVPAIYCATRHNPVDSTDERQELKEGKPVVVTHVVQPNIDSLWEEWSCLYGSAALDTASFIRYLKSTVLKCPPCTSRTDTLKHSTYQRAVNKAAVDSTANHYKKLLAEKDKELQHKDVVNTALRETIAGLKVSLSYFIWATIILGSYTLLRWVLRIWKIRLP